MNITNISSHEVLLYILDIVVCKGYFFLPWWYSFPPIQFDMQSDNSSVKVEILPQSLVPNLCSCALDCRLINF